MDDQRVGALLRAVRVRRRLRQVDIARLAGVSDQMVSRIERGRFEATSLAALRRVARVLEARVDVSIWTRAGDVERIASARHAELVEAVISSLAGLGWVARPAVSFNQGGERGLVDILAWHAATHMVLVIEVKTEIVDVGELIGTFDRKRRLAPTVAAQAGLSPIEYAAAPIVADTTTNHRRVHEHAATFRAALPDSGQRFRAFIRRPSGRLAAVAFWPNRHAGSVRRPASAIRRVRQATAAVARRDPRSEQPSGAALHAGFRGLDHLPDA